MAKNFSIVADIQLRGPKNIRGIATQIHRGLSGIKAKVDVDISRGVTARLNGLNTILGRVNTSLRAIRTNARSATTQLAALATALQNLTTIQSKFTFNSKFTNNLTKSVSKAKSEITEFGEQSALAVRRFAAFAAPTAILFGLIGAIKEGITAAVSFEKEMTRLSQVTGRSVENLSSLSKEITRLSTGLGVSSAELGGIATTLAQAGLSARDTTKALEALARSGLSASFGDIKNTTEGVIAVMAQFGVSADQLQGKLGSINAVSAQFAVESEDLVSAIRRTGGAFKASGGELEELLALFTSVRATTRESADSIATGFRTIFTRVQRPRTIQYLKELGVNLADLEGKFIGPYESVRRLSAALKDVEGTDPRFAAIVEELGGFRQVSKVIPLIQQFDLAQKALNTSQSGALSIVEDSEIAQKSLANQIVKVKEEFLALFRELTADDSFKATVKLILDMSRGIIDLTRALKPLIPLMAALAVTQAATTSGQFLSGFAGGLSKHKGGGKRRFASGGIVPGSGRGDKTHLMAEPGEFVVRRDAVDKLGRGTLANINANPQKFAKGDFVQAAIKAGKDKVALKALARQEFIDQGIPIKSEQSLDTMIGKLVNPIVKGSLDPEKSFNNIFNPKKADTAEVKRAKTVINKAKTNSAIHGEFKIGDTPQFGILAPVAESLSNITKRTKVESLPANAIKNISRLSGFDPKSILNATATGTMGVATLNPALHTNFNKAAGSGIHNLLGTVLDAANVEPALQKMGMSRDGTIDKMAKKIDVSPIHGKIFEGFVAALTQQFTGHPQASFDFKPDKSFDAIFSGASRFGLGDAKGNINNKTALNMLGKAFTSANSYNALSPDFLSIFFTGGAKKATGGKIKGNEVPIIAEPGEFIINKDSAQKLGPKKLRSLNNADRMHTGGFVGKFAKGGNVGSSGLSQSGQAAFVIGSLTQVAASFGQLEGTTGKLVTAFATLSFAVGGVKTVLDGFVNQDRARALGLFGTSSSARAAGLTVGNKGLDKAIGFAARNVDKFNLGIAVASSALLIWGQNLESDAIKLAEHAQTEGELNKATSKNTFAAGLKGAGAGAGIGAALGSVIPGVGTAIGAVVGASIGGLAGVMTANNEKLIQVFKQSKFDKVAESLDTLSSDFAAGRINSQTFTAGTAQAAKSQLENISRAGSAESRASFTKQLRGDEADFRTAIASIVNTASTIEEFESAFGNSGEILISTIQTLTNKTYPQVRKEIENEIRVRVESKKASASVTKALAVFDSISISLNSFSSAIDDASDSLNALTPTFEALVANISGDIVSGKSGSSAITSGIFGRAASGGISNDNTLRNATKQLFGGLGSGLSGTDISSDIESLAVLTRELPGILERSAAKTGLGATNNQAAISFEKEFDSTLSKFDVKLGNSIKSIFSAELSSREGGGDAGFIRATREQVGELVKKLLPDSIQASASALEAATKSIADQTSLISDRLGQQVKIELDLAKQRADIEEKKLEVEQSALRDGKTLSLERVKSAFSEQQNVLLGSTGISKDATADTIADELSKVLREREKVSLTLSTAKPGKEAANVQDTLAGLNSQAGKLRSALENLAKSTLVVSKVQDELSKQEQDRASSKGLAQDLVFGGGAGRVDFAKSVSAINNIVKSGGSLTNLPETLRSSVLELLNKLPQNRKTEFLGDKTPTEFINASLKEDIIKAAKREGASPETADELFKLITAGTTEETDLRKQLVDLQRQSLEAQNKIATVSKEGFDKLVVENKEALKEFASKIEAALLETALSGIKSKRESVSNKILEGKAELGNFGKLSEFLGVSGDEGVTTANKLLANKESLKKIAEARQSMEGLKSVRGDKDVEEFTPEKFNTYFVPVLAKQAAYQKDIDKSIDKFLEINTINKSFSNTDKELFRKKINDSFVKTNIRESADKAGGSGKIRFLDKEQSLDSLKSALASGKDVGQINSGSADITQKIMAIAFAQAITDAFREQEVKLSDSMAAPSMRLGGAGITDKQIERFSNLEELKTLDNLLNGLSDASRNGSSSIDDLTKSIRDLMTEVNDIKLRERGVQAKIDDAKPKAFGGPIRGKGINKPLVSFTPQGSDRIPAMLSRGEFVVKKNAAQNNLPLLTAINAQGFAGGGLVDKLLKEASSLLPDLSSIMPSTETIDGIKKGAMVALGSSEEVAARAAKTSAVSPRKAALAALRASHLADKTGRRAAFQATHRPKAAGLTPGARALKEFRNEKAIGAATKNREEAASLGISVSQLLKNRIESNRKARESRVKLKAEDEFLFGSTPDPRKVGLEERRKKAAFLRSERKFSGLSPASSKIPTPSRLLKAVGFKGMIRKALGGAIPGVGSGDTVPSLLTPGEFVLNKRASASIGLNQLNRFNSGGAVGGDNSNKNITGSINNAQLTQSLTAFTQSASMLANSMSTWTQTASKLAEAIAGFPHEVTVQHSQIPVIVNVGGMQGLQENVQALVMAEVDKRLSMQTIKSADGKKPFMAGAA